MSEPSAPLAIVTGANCGIGLETCRQLGRYGWQVLLTSRDEDSGRKAAQTLAGEGLQVEYHPLDVSDSASVAALAQDLNHSGRRIRALVNNAGVSLDGFNADVARRTLAINFFGPQQVTDALLPLLEDHGSIVMVSSGMGELSCLSSDLRKQFLAPDLSRAQLDKLMNDFIQAVANGSYSKQGWPGSAYRVSKAGLNALTRILARELAGQNIGIRVNSVCPGWVRTDMGGPNAARPVSKGAETIVWASMLPADGPGGGFFRDKRPVGW
jgi:NAD(P)-dependent dehydrogenase (short-subunit alcohol dehydrogenase family)